jgi:hypothetical protein
MTAENRKLIPRRVFREMQNISTMTQHRREKSISGYPKPIVISNRVYFFETDVSRYLESLRGDHQAEGAAGSSHSAAGNPAT